jgi:hypothetical protein
MTSEARIIQTAHITCFGGSPRGPDAETGAPGGS